jgi:glucose/arabinose dehydrogenase
MNKTLSFFVLLPVSMILSLGSACQSSAKQAQSDSAKQGQQSLKSPVQFTAEKLYDKFSNAWGMVWLPDGRLLVTERSGRILVFKDDKYTGENLTGVPEVFDKGQGGLLDITIHPDYAKNKWIYISYSKPVTGGATTAIMRFKLSGNQLTEQKDIFLARPFLKADYHFGSRIIFDKDNFLYFSSGERGTQPKVQQLDNDHGKIHRIHDDGRIPNDNPYVGQKDAKGSIWTYGHRNPQGMVYDASTNRIWAVEHGPKGGDELNLIEKGKNYGWPKTSYGINYDGSVLTKFKEMEGVQNPVRYWVPSIGPCGMMMVTSNRFPDWKGNLLIGALAFRHIARVQLKETSYAGEEKLLQDMGRFRHIAQSPDGYIYALTEGPGLLLKLLPEKR